MADEKNVQDSMTQLALRVSEQFLDVDRKVRSMIQNKLQEIIMAGMGITTARSKVEVYRTNGFRNALDGLIEDIAQNELEKAALPTYENLIKDTKFRNAFKKALEASFADAYGRHLSKLLRSRAEAALATAEREFSAEVVAIQKNFDDILQPIVLSARASVLERLAKEKQ